MNELESVLGCEKRLMKLWPAVSTEMIDEWAVRFANGYSGRANSASALAEGAKLDAKLLQRIEAMYRAANLPPQLRVTPLVDRSAPEFLRNAGFVVKDTALAMMSGLSQTSVCDSRVLISTQADQRWLDGVCARQEASKRNPAHLLAIVGQIKAPVAFATVMVDGRPQGFGVCAIDDGWSEIGSVVIDEAHRGRRLGLAIMQTLLAWAKSHGAYKAFLQVDTANDAAIALYRKLAFVPSYFYDTWRKT